MNRLISGLALVGLLISFNGAISYAGSPADAPKQGIRAEFLGQLADVEKKIEGLAAAMPADKYSWHPGEGVRSVGEVYTHIVATNYMFMTFLGTPSPVKLDLTKEDMGMPATGKDEIVKLIKPSFDHMRTVITGLSDSDLDKTTQMFGGTFSYRAVLSIMLGHLHEHLGQSIAYARVNNVVPPWTAAEQAAAAAKKDAK